MAISYFWHKSKHKILWELLIPKLFDIQFFLLKNIYHIFKEKIVLMKFRIFRTDLKRIVSAQVEWIHISGILKRLRVNKRRPMLLKSESLKHLFFLHATRCILFKNYVRNLKVYSTLFPSSIDEFHNLIWRQITHLKKCIPGIWNWQQG